MKKNRLLKLIVSLLLVTTLLVIVGFIYQSKQNAIVTSGQSGLTSIKKSKVYHIPKEDLYFKLIDNQHFVMMSGRYLFDSDKELQQYRRKNEDFGNPELIFEEGEYRVKNSKYYIQITKTSILTFTSIKAYKSKIYYSKITENNDDIFNNDTITFIVKQGGAYKRTLFKGKGQTEIEYLDIVESHKELPDSSEELFSQYTDSQSAKTHNNEE